MAKSLYDVLTAWKSVPGHNYLQRCDNLKILHPKLLKLLKQHSTAFDNYWIYQLQGNGVVTRKPLILFRTDDLQERKINCPGCGRKLTFPKDFNEE